MPNTRGKTRAPVNGKSGFQQMLDALRKGMKVFDTPIYNPTKGRSKKPK